MGYWEKIKKGTEIRKGREIEEDNGEEQIIFAGTGKRNASGHSAGNKGKMKARLQERDVKEGGGGQEGGQRGRQQIRVGETKIKMNREGKHKG